jgi:hypothetical protein
VTNPKSKSLYGFYNARYRVFDSRYYFTDEQQKIVRHHNFHPENLDQWLEYLKALLGFLDEVGWRESLDPLVPEGTSVLSVGLIESAILAMIADQLTIKKQEASKIDMQFLMILEQKILPFWHMVREELRLVLQMFVANAGPHKQQQQQTSS